MIKQFKIQNMYGIKNMDIDFKLKNIYQSDEDLISEQMVKIDGDIYSMIPSFISKNASYKTSMIKSLDVILGFLDKSNLEETITNAATKIMHKTYFSQRVSKDIEIHSSEEAQDTSETFIMYIQKEMERLFNNIIFAGEKEFNITVCLEKNHEFELFGNEQNIIVQNNKTNTTFSLFEIFEQIGRKLNYKFTSHSNIGKIVLELINEMNFDFPENVYYEFITVDDNSSAPRWMNSDSFDAAHKNIKDLIDIAGFDFVKTLLSKADSRIEAINNDISTKSFEIYIKDGHVPISPKNLSYGTKKLLNIINHSFYIFKYGGVLLIDEIETGLHLSLIRLIIEMFSDPDLNKKNAQLILTSHNPNIVTVSGVNPKNVLLSNEDKYMYIKEFRKRNINTDELSWILSKNYYNDMFWIQRESDIRSTLTDIQIKIVIDSLGETFNKFLRSNLDVKNDKNRRIH